jgi:hypothetical protein
MTPRAGDGLSHAVFPCRSPSTLALVVGHSAARNFVERIAAPKSRIISAAVRSIRNSHGAMIRVEGTRSPDPLHLPITYPILTITNFISNSK